MVETTTLNEAVGRVERKLTDACSGTVDRVEATMLGTVEIEVFDCSMSDIDCIDELVGVNSVERNPTGSLTIESAAQVAPCSGGRQ